MVDKYYAGNDVVYGVRNARKTDTFFKKFTAEGFYKVMKMMGADVVFNHADYRLMSRRALDGLESFKEVNMFLRGVVPMIGYKSDKVYYARKERFAGTSKYPLKKMLSFAWEGITSLSTKPIALITRLPGEHHHADLFLRAALHGRNHHGLDFADRVHLGNRRLAAPRHRRHRAVHRKGRLRDKGTPEVYH